MSRGNYSFESEVLTDEELKELFAQQGAKRDELVQKLEQQIDKEINNPARTTFHNPFLNNETSLQQAVLELQSRYEEIIPTDDGSLPGMSVDSTKPQMDTVTAEVADSVVSSINSQTQEFDEWELSGWWLKAAQTLLMTRYIQSENCTDQEEDALLDFLATLQIDLDVHDRFSLASVLTTLVETPSHEIASNFTVDTTLPLTAQMSSLLLQMATRKEKHTSAWIRQCIKTYIAANPSGDELQKIYSEAILTNWSGSDMLKLFDLCCQHHNIDTHKQLLHLTQTYEVRPEVVVYHLENDPENIISKTQGNIDSEGDKSITIVIREIRETKLVEQNLLSHVHTIAEETMIYTYCDPVETYYEAIIQESNHVVNARATFELLGNPNNSVSNDDIASALYGMLAVCHKIKGWHPRPTQVVSLVLLLLSSRQKSNQLLEVLTGEGKSVIVAMLATILAIQGKHVDVLTSSPVLAVRDVEEWKEFYEQFNITVSHITDLNRPQDADGDAEKMESYKKQVVYGTVGNFAGDILRKEFDHDDIRGDRPLDVAIVDEVDMLMLDEGVQFTYLSHDGAILRHLEPVIAAVWSIVGPLNVTRSIDGTIYYASSPKLFTQAIFECLDPEFTGIDSHTQILGIARDIGIISQSQFDILDGEDQELKKFVMSNINLVHEFSLVVAMGDYENMPEFKVFRANSEGALEPISLPIPSETITDEDSKEALLLLDDGLACVLNTQEQIVDRGAVILQSKMQYSGGADTEGKINVPKHMRQYVESQLPMYVKSAVRALHMEQDREYSIWKGRIVPVDFQNSGVLELNKKWGGGLQQMLEMKHKIALTPPTLVTNFMSNVEFFSRYKDSGGIYGMSGTLGLDQLSSTRRILKDLYNANVCSIPSARSRKLIEKPAILVGNHEQWFQKIVDTVNEANTIISTWKKKRATLILCEDIRTAEDLRAYVVETANWNEDDVHLYAHSSSSKQLNTITQELGPGEVIIATNLAGRGTHISVSDEVNASGGLLCLVTFLPRNRRVELQAFGRTARSGQPGSVQCILNYSTMPVHYDGMTLEDIRTLRAEEESVRLHDLMEFDIKELKLRETLFKQYCEFLEEVHELVKFRSDKDLIVGQVNEAWAIWLELNKDNIEMHRELLLTSNLRIDSRYWKPANLMRLSVDQLDDPYPFFETGREIEVSPRDTFSPLMSAASNFYHYIQLGNKYYGSTETDNFEKAKDLFGRSIELEPTYSAIAYYNRAYAILQRSGILWDYSYKNKAKEDIQNAIQSVKVYMTDVSTVSQCAAIVRLSRDFKERPPNDEGEGEPMTDLDTQTNVRYQLLQYIKKHMEEAVEKINEYGGHIRAKPADIFSLIPAQDYVTNLELARLHSLGLEILYEIEKVPPPIDFSWEGLVVFLLGVCQVVGGVLLTVFSAGAAAQFGMALIGEGISDCIDGIEGMVTGEFSWVEWGISKAVGIGLSLATGGISRLASSGLKAVKAGFKIAKHVGKQLKAVPKIISTTSKSAAKSNLKTASKYVLQEATLQGVSYSTAKVLNLALEEAAKQIGKKLREKFVEKVKTAFSSGYLGEVLDGSLVAEMDTSFSSMSSVPASIQDKGESMFGEVGDTVATDLNDNSPLKERVATSSLAFFSQLSQKSKELRGVVNLAESALILGLVVDAVQSLSYVVDEFHVQMEDVAKKFVTDGKIVISTQSPDPYKGYSCVIKLRNDLAEQVADIFANTVAVLLQGKLRPLVNQYQMTNKVGRLTNKVIGKYVLKSDKTMEDLRAIQHSNYIRAVGFDSSSSGPVSNSKVANLYALDVASSDAPGSLLELRIAAEHYGQKVTVYTEKDGRLVKDTIVDPYNKTTTEEVELVYIPPRDADSAGHYDALVRGVRTRVQSEQSNCLFHAYAFSRNTGLSQEQLRQEAQQLRETVAADIRNDPGRFAEHIKLRLEMDSLRRGNRFVMIGAGRPNRDTKVLKGFFKQKIVGDKIYTMYEQANGVKCKAWRRYNKNLTLDSKNVVQETDARLKDFEVTMEGLNLHKNAGKRCWHTKPVVGMIKRPKGDRRDTEVSYHLCPSRGGANAGDQYANAIPASTHYNNLEKYIWSTPLQNVLGNNDFKMTVRGFCGPLDQVYRGNQDLDAATKALLDKRYALIQKLEPRAYRLEDPTTFTVFIPSSVSVTQKDLDDIVDATHFKESNIGCDTDLASRTVTFYMPQDYELFTPKDLDTRQLDANGELYPGELTKATLKQKQLTVGIPPYYRSTPTGGKTTLDLQDFDDEFTKFAV